MKKNCISSNWSSCWKLLLGTHRQCF